MNATTEDDQEQDPPDDAEAEEVHPEELEGELEVLLTQAAKKRAEIQKARGFSRERILPGSGGTDSRDEISDALLGMQGPWEDFVRSLAR